MTENEIKEWKARIDGMSQEEMCRKWRFTPSGDPLMCEPLFPYFKARLNSLGGFTTAISKKIGWDK